MGTDKLRDLLDRIPMTLLVILFAAYVGYDYLQFLGDAPFVSNPNAPLLLKKKEVEAMTTENAKLKQRVDRLQDFMKNLEGKRAELRRLALDLEAMKTTLPENLDIPDFMKTVVTEAKKVGITVVGLKPTESFSKEYYGEQAFDFQFRGVYVQLLVFLERLSSIQKIVRVDNFSIKPMRDDPSRFVELEGVVQIKAYRYLRSKADELGKTEAANKAGGT